MPHQIRYALVRALPTSFSAALQQEVPAEAINVDLAHQQHARYTEALRAFVGELIEVPADERFPDCCFIEDTAIIVGDKAILARIGAKSRRGEVAAIDEALQALQNREHQLSIHRLKAPATLDGGDVLQMAGKVFVGLSKRTNIEAVKQLEEVMPGQIVSVPVSSGLHLKSVLSAIDDQTLIVADHPGALAMSEVIRAALPGDVEVLRVPDLPASNIVRVHNRLLIQKGFPRSELILEALAHKKSLQICKLSMSELIKADGALTCCSLLISEAAFR